MREIFRLARMTLPTLLLVVLTACGSFQPFDAAKNDVATAIKTQYAGADILGTLDIQRANLAALSTEEIKIVRENLAVQRDFALLEIVDNDTPMGMTWVQEIKPAMAKVGFENAGALRKYIQGVATRDTVRDAQLDGLADRIKRQADVQLPACRRLVPLPSADDFTWPPGLDETKLTRAKAIYTIYADACRKQLSDTADLGKGDLLRAQQRWESAKAELKNQQQAVRDEAKNVAQARKSHTAAVKAASDAGNTGKDLRQKIKDSAEKFEKTLEKAAKIAPGVVSNERITGLVTLLSAAAGGGEILDTPDDANEDLADAVLLVNGISSLAADVATLVAKGKAPSVSNLLIELNHQVVLLNHARAMATLDQERVAILRAQYFAYGDEAAELLRFHDALCSFGIMEAGGAHPGSACDTFTVSDDGKTCTGASGPIADCGLTESWKKYLKAPPSGAAGREFYKGLAAFNRLFPLRASRVEGDFKLVDLQHRRNLAAREMALKAWDNLAAVPIDQIQAYYASGIKPAEIADLLVKALGLTAIAVGVSN